MKIINYIELYSGYFIIFENGIIKYLTNYEIKENNNGEYIFNYKFNLKENIKNNKECQNEIIRAQSVAEKLDKNA
jgi:hypothetical protein